MSKTRSFYIPSFLVDSAKSNDLTLNVMIKLSRGGTATRLLYGGSFNKQLAYHSQDNSLYALTPEGNAQITQQASLSIPYYTLARTNNILDKLSLLALAMYDEHLYGDLNTPRNKVHVNLEEHVAKLIADSKDLSFAIDTDIENLPVSKYFIVQDENGYTAYPSYVVTNYDGRLVTVYNNSENPSPTEFLALLSKFMSPEELANYKAIASDTDVTRLREKIDLATPTYAKKGGKLINIKSSEKNVIPEGALHAHRNNLDIIDVTNKGIPVISAEDGGKVIQHAEIEREEIIFNLDFTEEMERIATEFNSSDNAEERNNLAIELGKMATYEIIKNTKDYTGLIKATE